ncbi:uncharacterized protein WCI35_023706, partial [Daubentonia madagascariensis]
TKPFESMETKMDNFRRRLLIIIIGVMIIAFVFTCFCFLHFNCMSDDVPKAGMVKKEGIAAKTSRSSKMSFSESKTASLCSPEKQSMLSTIDKLSRPLSAEKSSIPSSAEKLIRPLSPEKSSIPSSAEKLIRPLSPEKSSIPSSAEKLIRSSSPKKSSKPSSSKKLFRSSHLEKSYRMRTLKKSYKLSHAPKLVSQVTSDKPVRTPWPASLQCPARLPSKTPCPPYPQNQILPPKPSRLQKSTKAPRHLKRSVSIGKAVLLSRPQLAETCQCYKERCLVCKTFSEPLVNDISEAKKKKAQNLPVSSKVKPFPRSFHKVDSKDDAYHNNVSDSDMMTYNSDDDSDREITIICNMRQNEVIFKGTPDN